MTSGVSSESGGIGLLTWIVLLGLVGLAFGGGILFSVTRRGPEPYRGPSVRTPEPSARYEPNDYEPAASEPAGYLQAEEEPAEAEFADDDLLANPTIRFEDDR